MGGGDEWQRKRKKTSRLIPLQQPSDDCCNEGLPSRMGYSCYNKHLFLLSLLCERCGIQSNDNPAMAKHYLKDEHCEPIQQWQLLQNPSRASYPCLLHAFEIMKLICRKVYEKTHFTHDQHQTQKQQQANYATGQYAAGRRLDVYSEAIEDTQRE